RLFAETARPLANFAQMQPGTAMSIAGGFCGGAVALGTAGYLTFQVVCDPRIQDVCKRSVKCAREVVERIYCKACDLCKKENLEKAFCRTKEQVGKAVDSLVKSSLQEHSSRESKAQEEGKSGGGGGPGKEPEDKPKPGVVAAGAGLATALGVAEGNYVEIVRLTEEMRKNLAIEAEFCVLEIDLEPLLGFENRWEHIVGKLKHLLFRLAEGSEALGEEIIELAKKRGLSLADGIDAIANKIGKPTTSITQKLIDETPRIVGKFNSEVLMVWKNCGIQLLKPIDIVTKIDGVSTLITVYAEHKKLAPVLHEGVAVCDKVLVHYSTASCRRIHPL
ncbi:hypothetical protein KAU11_05110, partial [Candidatus Babeliales bacterium]|nr:hypothetical protein [Candidatus Babeliales bacterium]